MDLKNAKKSKNFVDKTGYTEKQKMIDGLLAALNPVAAYRNIRGKMLENGYIDAPKREINYNLMSKNMPASQNFVDRTGGHQDFIIGKRDIKSELFLQALEAARREGQIGPMDYMIEPAPPRKLIDPRKKRAPYL